MTNTCGHDTPNGPCQNPVTPDNPEDGKPSRCWIPSHNDPDAENPHGRPEKLADRRDDILTGARQGMTIEGCARLAGVAKDTLYRWLNKYDDFSDAFKRARAQGELKHLQSVNDRGSQFILERSFGYVKTEKREVDMDADISSEGFEIIYDGDED